jgi:hypothetical protein
MPSPFYTNTPRYSLRSLLGSSNLSDIDAGFLAALTDVENKFTGYTSGTHAARLAASNIDGLLWRETDTGLVYVGTGTTWLAVALLDSGGHVPLGNLSGITDTQLASPNNTVRRLLLESSNQVQGITAGVQVIDSRVWIGDAGLSSQPQDFQVAGKTAYARIRAAVLTNNTAPGATLTFGLYPVTAVTGGAGVISYGTGPVFTGSTVAINPSSAGGWYAAESAQFALPLTVTAFYVLGVSWSANQAASSVVGMTAQLYAYNA